MGWLYNAPPWLKAFTGTAEEREDFDWGEWAEESWREIRVKMRLPLMFGIGFAMLIGWTNSSFDSATEDNDRIAGDVSGEPAPGDYAHTSADNPWAKARD